MFRIQSEVANDAPQRLSIGVRGAMRTIPLPLHLLAVCAPGVVFFVQLTTMKPFEIATERFSLVVQVVCQKCSAAEAIAILTVGMPEQHSEMRDRINHDSLDSQFAVPLLR